MKKAHLIMPMGGAGSRFKKNGYEVPKPVIEIHGKPFFYWATRSIEKFVDLEDITFVALAQHIRDFHLDCLIQEYFPAANIIVLPEVTPGPVFTCLEGIKNIADEHPLLFNDCDHMFRCSGLNDLLNQGTDSIDGGLVTFKANTPQFSYVRYDANGNVIGTVEKEVVSNDAICGAYLFKNAGLFRSVASEYIETCPYKECFLSGMYNVMCQKNMRIESYMLDFHVEFGTPEEYENAKGSPLFAELE